MEWFDKVNAALDYIELHLTEEIDNVQLAAIVCCSPYHFTRMFSFISGITLSEYVRRRRITQATFELQNSEVKIVDLAMKYGYHSPTAFNRAFQSVQGMTPTEARCKGIPLLSYPKMSLLLSIKGGESLRYRIEDKSEFTILGCKVKMKTVNGNEDFEHITRMWAELSQDYVDHILAHNDGMIEGLIGASTNNDGERYDYYIGTTAKIHDGSSDIKADDILIVPKATWAIFQVLGPLPEAMIEVWKRIFTEWFPTSNYESADLPCLEIYSEGDTTAKDYSSELWLPVIPN